MTPAPAQEIVVTVLVDNTAEPGLRAEHGFGAWVQVAGRQLLFDTGQGQALTPNADRLDVDLGAADALVLSHGHYDHTGGVALVVERAPAVRIYGHPAALGPHLAIRSGAARSIAMPPAARAATEIRMQPVTGPLELADGVGVTGPIPRLSDFEDVGGPFFTDAAGHKPDPLVDDQALWLRASRGLVVIVGCSHAGLINTLRYALKVSGQDRLHAVLGGFHLLGASAARLGRTTDALLELDPDLIVPCHCSGAVAVERLRQSLGERVRPGAAGQSYRFV